MRRTLLITTLSVALGGHAGHAGHALADRQPRMHNALRHLESGLDALEKASADKGGHRVKAIALVKSAIDEVKEGIKHDNAH